MARTNRFVGLLTSIILTVSASAWAACAPGGAETAPAVPSAGPTTAPATAPATAATTDITVPATGPATGPTTSAVAEGPTTGPDTQPGRVQPETHPSVAQAAEPPAHGPAAEHPAAGPQAGPQAGPHAGPSEPAHPAEEDAIPHPVLPDAPARWAGSMVVIILGMFGAAVVAGAFVRSLAPREVPPAHSHDEPPGASHHHGKSGTLNPEPDHGDH